MKKVDLAETDFEIRISDFGFSKVLDGKVTELSIVGTLLYQAPQLISSTWYNETVDIWAVGCILFELVNGVTPFHCSSEEEMALKLEDGRYIMATTREPVCIETCKFLLECLQEA